MTVRIKHESKGYKALLTDPAIVADLHDRAKRIAAAAGGEPNDFYAPAPSAPRKRARAVVIAPRGDSDNAMIRSLDAGR